jgi:hypothetical protein
VAKRPAQSQGALSRQVENDEIAAFVWTLSPAHMCDQRQISNDRD